MKTEIINLLTVLRNKGAVIYCQNLANKTLRQIKSLLTIDEYTYLEIAHGHYLLGEGGQELRDKCNELILKYRNEN